ncbi:MAG: serine hydroxymethyltransferase [Alphaproteobacteria bacterium]|nr:serine hydroxymethyltransferase [Alphaproteobacteria bacterium]
MADAATLRAHFQASLAESDPEVAEAIGGELDRQRDQIELIASENLVSRAVLEAHGSVMTNKTVEGYPGKRYYGGAQFADRIEALGIARAKKLFGCGFANIQPHSGSQANQAVFLALLKPGDTILSMSTNAGGHISHGHPANQTGKHYAIVSYGVAKSDERLDYAEAEALALKHKPRLVIAGGSAYPRRIDFPRLRAIADKAGALFMVDMAHFAGLVATGLHPNPFPHAHIVTTTTYKSLRGARGGVVLTNDAALAKKIDNAVFPGVQGSVLLHAVAGKTVCLGEALKPAFRDYCQAVVDNAQALAKAVAGEGLRVVSGGTDTGLMLVDLTAKGVQGQRASESLEAAGLNVNKNTIPFDPRTPEDPSGLRLSSNAGTARGLGADEFGQIGRWIGRVLDGLARRPNDNGAAEHEVRAEVQAMCRRFPIYG